jgi:predicted dehydrogenase
MHFLECISEGKQPLSDGYDGLKVVQVVEAAQLSLKDSGRVVPVSDGFVSAAELRNTREGVNG